MKKVVVFMLVLAVFTTALGLSSQKDFFVVSSSVFDKVNFVVMPLYNTLQKVIQPDIFDPDQEICVERYYFNDGAVYCDIAYVYQFPTFNFASRTFLYSSDSKVAGYVRWSLWRTAVRSLFTHDYVDSAGETLYSVYPWNVPYILECTYFEYLTDYKLNPSTDGWRRI